MSSLCCLGRSVGERAQLCRLCAPYPARRRMHNTVAFAMHVRRNTEAIWDTCQSASKHIARRAASKMPLTLSFAANEIRFSVQLIKASIVGCLSPPICQAKKVKLRRPFSSCYYIQFFSPFAFPLTPERYIGAIVSLEWRLN